MYKEHGKHIIEAMFYTVSSLRVNHPVFVLDSGRCLSLPLARTSTTWIPHICTWHMEMFDVILA